MKFWSANEFLVNYLGASLILSVCFSRLSDSVLNSVSPHKFLNFTKQTIQHSGHLHAGIGQLYNGVRELHAGF